MIIVYAYAVCDVLHSGHLDHFERAKGLGDKLIVGVLTNKAVMEKKPEPTLDYNERARIVKSLRWVDIVVPQDTYSPLENVIKLRPDILTESSNHIEQPANEFMISIGGRVIELPYYEGLSSTKIKKRILENYKCQE